MYNFKEIEKKWQDRWIKEKCFEADNKSDKITSQGFVSDNQI